MAKRPFISYNAFAYRERFDHHSSRIFNNKGCQREYDCTVDPPALYFGTIAVGEQSAVQRVVVTNIGYKTLPIRSVTGVGDFIVSSDNPLSLEPGETFYVTAIFSPQRGGASSGGIYVDTGDAAGKEFVMLMGAGAGGTVDPGDEDDFDLSVTSIAFGQQQINTPSTARTVTITNTTGSAITIALATVAGFTLNKTSLTVPANGTGTFTVVFNPATVGAKTGSVTLTTTAKGTKTISLTGTGANTVPSLPTITLTSVVIEEVSDSASVSSNVTSLAFGAVAVGESSTERTITLTNNGALDAEILTVVVGGDYALASGSAQVGDAITAGGGHAVFNLVFSPTADGASPGQIQITTDAALGSTFTIPFTGSGSSVVVPSTPRLKVMGNQMVTVEDETPVVLKSVNWFGAEGTNYTPHGTWAIRWTDVLDNIADWGFNCVRMPFSGDFTTAGRTPPPTAFDFDLNPEFEGKTALEIMDMILDYCETKGLYVVFDHHRRQAGQGADGAPTGSGYTQSQWIASWQVMANRYKDHPVVVGADVHNEPHDLTWSAWATLVEACGNSILTTAPDWLIFVEGVGVNSDSTSYWWGGALKDVATRPISLTVPNKVVYSPHEYGQSVGSQDWLSKGGNNVPNYPNNLYAVWDANWGFIYKNNIAPIWIGEFGGFFGIDGNGANTKPDGVVETQWVTTLIKYLNGDFNGDGTSDLAAGKKGLSAAYWSYNPNSGDTGGLVRDDWSTPQTVKLNLLAPFLSN